jgi:hypothetical protein
MNPALQKICELATIHLYEWMRDFHDDKMPYKPANLAALADCWDSLAEDFWKEDVFGN